MLESSSQVVDFEKFARLSLATGFHYFKLMEKALGADTRRYMAECLKLKSETSEAGTLSQEKYADLGFWYRGLVRALMIYIEGMLFVMRQLIIYAEERREITLSTEEAVLIREREFSVNVKRKKIQERIRPNRFLENFIITFDLFPRVFGSSFRIDYGDHGWEKLQELVKLRNTLTHPKSVDDTLLKAETPNLIRDAATWFFSCMRDFIGSVDTVKLEKSMKQTVAMPEMRELLAEGRRRNEP